MKSARCLVADLDRRLAAQALLHGCVPLRNILRLLVRVECREAGDRGPQHGGSEIEARDRRHEGIALVRLGEDDGSVVEHVAPRIHIDGRVEDAEAGAEDQAALGRLVRNAESRRETRLVGEQQSLGCARLAADICGKRRGRNEESGPVVRNIVQRAHILVAQPKIQCRVRREPPGILHERAGVPLAQIHVRRSHLPLPHRGQLQQIARQRGAGAVAGRGSRRVTAGELV